MLPLLVLGLLLIVRCAALAAEHVALQAVAAQTARAAAAGADPHAVIAAVGLPQPDTRLSVTRQRVSGDPAAWVRVELAVRSQALRLLGVRIELVGRGIARTESAVEDG